MDFHTESAYFIHSDELIYEASVVECAAVCGSDGIRPLVPVPRVCPVFIVRRANAATGRCCKIDI